MCYDIPDEQYHGLIIQVKTLQQQGRKARRLGVEEPARSEIMLSKKSYLYRRTRRHNCDRHTRTKQKRPQFE